MIFSSIPFLYYFLPVVWLVYFAAPKGWKNGVLLLFSLVFYGWGEPKMLLLMVFTILAFYFCGLAMERGRKGAWLTVSVVLGVGLLALFKYGDFFLGSINAVTGLSLPLLGLSLPVGISFYTFQCLSYAIDVYRGRVPAQKSLVNFGAYVALFPQLIAGPIVRYTDVARELESRTHSWENWHLGLRRFLIGLGKKVILADNFALLLKAFRETGEPSVLFHWLYAVGFLLNIYFDFSGYSDMAIGLGRIFGFHFCENFDYPYLSKSVTEFWRRWHMSLGSWFRDYVYIPLGGNRVGKRRWVFNILVVWMLTGLWHGAAWNFVLWGLVFGLLLLLEKRLPLQRLPKLVRHGYLLLVVTVSFVLFNADTLSQAAGDIGGLFGLGGLPLVSSQAVYCLKSNAVLLIVGALGATPLPRKLATHLEGTVLEPVFLVAILLVCTGYLVDGSYSPFLYFRF